jgi:hypothetical protein
MIALVVPDLPPNGGPVSRCSGFFLQDGGGLLGPREGKRSPPEYPFIMDETVDRCPEATCNSAPQRDREDQRCYYHAKIWDGLIEREPRKKGGAPREFLDAGRGRLMQIQ